MRLLAYSFGVQPEPLRETCMRIIGIYASQLLSKPFKQSFCFAIMVEEVYANERDTRKRRIGVVARELPFLAQARKSILTGADTEFVLHHSAAWTVCVPFNEMSFKGNQH